MPCNEQWCSECYALSILLPSENDENKIEFGEPEAMEKIETTPIYLIENQSALQLKYFNNNGQGMKPEKAHEIDAGYDLRYPGKDTFVLKPKSLTKINLKIALKILPGAIVQITSRSSLASKRINVRGGIIDAGYTGDITIEHAEKIVQAIYLPLINISISVNIALNTKNESHQILRLPQPITISPFGEHPEIYICSKPTTTQQIFDNIFQQELPQTVPDFSEIIGHSLPKINPNPRQLEPQQQTQLKELIVEFADIFAENNNNLGRTDLVQHQIYTENAKPKRQQAYQVALESHQFI
ncbi:hypothetical protein G9A89_012739 [Geosiphon pyriformis]|nr:hypothetical protein G9A89_012739 [Geosiphon pyriformis]